MRKVMFKKWIKEVYSKESNGRVNGTGCFQDEFANSGIFHQWGNAYQVFESGPGNYTVGIVELKDGTIVEVLPTNIKFVN